MISWWLPLAMIKRLSCLKGGENRLIRWRCQGAPNVISISVLIQRNLDVLAVRWMLFWCFCGWKEMHEEEIQAGYRMAGVYQYPVSSRGQASRCMKTKTIILLWYLISINLEMDKISKRLYNTALMSNSLIDDDR